VQKLHPPVIQLVGQTFVSVGKVCLNVESFDCNLHVILFCLFNQPEFRYLLLNLE